MKTKSTKKVKKTATAKIGNNFVKSPKTRTTKASLKFVETKTNQNSLLSGLIQEDNNTLTENGAKTYKSTLNSILDLFAMGGALRSRSDAEVIQLFTKAFAEDQLLTLKCVFNIRNCRGGAGERKVFRTILRYLGDNYKDVVKKNIENIAFFGRFDDVFDSLRGTKSEEIALEYISRQLNLDVVSYEKKKTISLLAKWLPSNNTSSKETVKKANYIAKYLGWTAEQYRKTLSTLRKYSNVVEVVMSAREWESIDYSKIPSGASLKYRKAFFKHDEARYQKFIDDVKSGKKKVNASVLYPYEIAEKVFAGDKTETLDILWSNLPNYLENSDRNILVIADVSGSMSGRPMAISTSLALYTAERNKGGFNNYFMTFSDNPQLVRVVGNNVREKINNISRADWGMSTNLQSAFSLILNTAVKNRVKESDMPAQVIIVSDMEFNHAGQGTNLNAIQEKYRAAGYEIPQLVWWNVNSRNNNVPATADKKGNLLVSGASPSVFKTLLSGKQYTPVDQMLETLNQEVYDRVKV